MWYREVCTPGWSLSTIWMHPTGGSPWRRSAMGACGQQPRRRSQPMQNPQVVVVGSANADLVLDIDHRPAPGETIIGSDVVTTPGGKGANQAVAAGKMGGAVAFVGCVGDDDHGT